MREAFQYYKRCLYHSLRLSVSTTRNLLFYFSILVAVVGLFTTIPSIDTNIILKVQVQQLSAIFFGIVILFRILYSFYSVSKEDEKKNADEISILQAKLKEFEHRFRPRIQIFVRSKGVAEDYGSKYIQIGVSCATNQELNDCEVWLVSVRKIYENSNREDDELVPEKIHCVWSIQEKISLNLRPGLPEYANIFHVSPIISKDIDEPIRQPNKARVVPLTTPEKKRLTDGISEPGQYRLKVTVSAGDGVQPATGSLIFRYKDYDHVSLIREADVTQIHA